MRLTRRGFILGAMTGTAGLSGCAGIPGSESPTTIPDESTPTETTTTIETTTEERAPTVQSSNHSEFGEILVGSDGMTLYMFDQDSQGAGESTCYDSCATAWPPLTVEEPPISSDSVTATLTTFEREDGAQQVAANGWPLYYFASDEEPGDATGQSTNGVWWVVAPDGTPVKPQTTTEKNQY